MNRFLFFASVAILLALLITSISGKRKDDLEQIVSDLQTEMEDVVRGATPLIEMVGDSREIFPFSMDEASPEWLSFYREFELGVRRSLGLGVELSVDASVDLIELVVCVVSAYGVTQSYTFQAFSPEWQISSAPKEAKGTHFLVIPALGGPPTKVDLMLSFDSKGRLRAARVLRILR